MQPQGHMQVLNNLIVFRDDPQAALDRPRFCVENGTAGGGIALEDGIPTTALERLTDMGHRIHAVAGQDRALFGRGQIILRDRATGVLCGGSDPRADGLALGF